jgi:hypothetical protein
MTPTQSVTCPSEVWQASLRVIFDFYDGHGPKKKIAVMMKLRVGRDGLGLERVRAVPLAKKCGLEDYRVSRTFRLFSKPLKHGDRPVYLVVGLLSGKWRRRLGANARTNEYSNINPPHKAAPFPLQCTYHFAIHIQTRQCPKKKFPKCLCDLTIHIAGSSDLMFQCAFRRRISDQPPHNPFIIYFPSLSIFP